MNKLIEVNGIDREINDRACEKLWALRCPLGNDVEMCDYNLPNSWACTREANHKGPHVAHGFADVRAVFDGGVRGYACDVCGKEAGYWNPITDKFYCEEHN